VNLDARLKSVVLVVPLALLGAACGSSSSSSTPTTSTSTTNTSSHAVNRLTTQRAPGIGAVLANGKGQTLYVYLPERDGKIKCAGDCTRSWPSLVVRAGAKPAVNSTVHPNLVGTIVNPSGGSIVTYAKWPLHTYRSDASHGSYRGQGSGGQWYMISPSGTVITKPVSSGSSGASGGY
jgi:predicted lipoprotein with Yx(FWY)xxD motif